MVIRTVFAMAEDCARGEALGWKEFVVSYAPIARRLIEHYFPTLQPEPHAHVTVVFRRARENRNGWFAGLRFANEREFLMAFRDLVFACERPAARLPVPELSLGQGREALRDLTVVHRELLWVFLKGYDPRQAADILMNAAATAGSLSEIARHRLAELVPGGASGGSARVLLEAAEKARTPDCLPLRVFNNLINGQISWQERDRAEQHIGNCLHCLDGITSFQEMIWYARHAQPLPALEVEEVLRELGMSPKKRGLVERLFTKSA